MEKPIEINQETVKSEGTTQIGVQYVGMTPDDASKLAIGLFNNNFPKLQETAQQTARERAEELCESFFNRLKSDGFTNFNQFADPDVQYVLYEAQKNYARFGDKSSMNTLSELIIKRVNNNSSHIKRIYDNAIIVAGQLNSTDLDCLSALFMLTRVRVDFIKSIEDVKNYFGDLIVTFCLDKVNYKKKVSFLNYLGCLQIQLPDIKTIFSKEYNLDKNEIESIMTETIKQFDGDYGVSEVGIAIAIANAYEKTNIRLDINNWIKE